MDYKKYERLLSHKRLNKYFNAVDCDAEMTLRLYELNIELSQAFYGILSYFEVIFRNKIDAFYKKSIKEEWLLHSIDDGGLFAGDKCSVNALHVGKKVAELKGNYSHDKLVAEMTFGFWRYLFSKSHFNAGGKTLLKVFPKKPKSSKDISSMRNFVLKN